MTATLIAERDGEGAFNLSSPLFEGPFSPYISPQGAAKLKEYRYHGGDHSLIYKHVLTPMNERLIKLFPWWLAPNTITVLGLALVFGSHLLSILYTPRLEGVAPGWVYVLFGLCLFAYQTLDNLDGKQARRTGSASPLGLLFDHGCDALNVTVSTLTLCSAIQAGPTWKSGVMWWSTASVFYFTTWEELNTDYLNLPTINGPTEGLIANVGIYFWTAYIGADFWLTTEPLTGYQWNTLLIWALMALALATILNSFKNVYISTFRSDTFGTAIARIAPFLILNVFFALWVSFSQDDILGKYPRMVWWTLGLLFSKMVTHMMVAHMTREPYAPIRKTLLPIFFLAAHASYSLFGWYFRGRSLNDPVIPDEELVLEEFFILALVTYSHLVYFLVREVMVILNVPCFTMPASVVHRFTKGDKTFLC
ncbi:MAG: CDP-alcohol phosphatidyltransferase family protein [archaeon]|nr:CDP-alcohol phosphatidyltransferase family protein [archaeon]